MTLRFLKRPLAGALFATCTIAAFGADAPAFAGPAVDLIPANVAPPAVALTDTPDFGELRIAYGRRLDYHQRCEASLPAKDWNDAQKAKDFPAAYGIAARWLATCPVVEMAQLWAMISADAMHDQARFEMHTRWYQGLLRSVLKSGDGKTPGTAWKTISVAEEYAVVQALEYRRGSQELLMHPLVDKLTVRPAKGGDEVSLYFNPELHFARLNYLLANKQ